MKNATEIIRKIFAKEEEAIREALSELISRNILVVEHSPLESKVTTSNSEYIVTATTGIRLVVKDMEYIRELEKKLALEGNKSASRGYELRNCAARFKALSMQHACIGKDVAHVDFNCTYCLARFGEQCIDRELNKKYE